MKVTTFASFVKLSHTIFAMPFALAMFVIATERYTYSSYSLLWVVIAIVAARTAAMAFNRLIDSKLDAKNPRTAEREIPCGQVSVSEARLVTLLAIMIFMAASFALGVHCLILAPLVLCVLLGYSLTKRFTSMSHVVLGLALAMAPGGVWYALSAEFSWIPVPLMMAVLFWVAGFDIIYSCQDVAFDASEGLHSIPTKIGVTRALALSRFFHLLAVVGLVIFGILSSRSIFYYSFVGVFAVIIASQHLLVSARDLSRVNQAFFVRNGVGSFIFFFGVLLDIYYK